MFSRVPFTTDATLKTARAVHGRYGSEYFLSPRTSCDIMFLLYPAVLCADLHLCADPLLQPLLNCRCHLHHQPLPFLAETPAGNACRHEHTKLEGSGSLNARVTREVDELLSAYDVVDEAQHKGAHVRSGGELLRHRYVHQPFQAKHHLRGTPPRVQTPRQPSLLRNTVYGYTVIRWTALLIVIVMPSTTLRPPYHPCT